DALSGRGRLLMLVGEPGIGKTRTSEEFATYAGLRNSQVLWGRCYEGEGAPAYWPWVQVVRSYVHDRDPQELMSEMGPGAADIAQVVSAVRERLPGLPEPPALEPEQARFRLFDSITTFLKNASNRQPIVLVLDDLHWADKPSLLLLQFLARELRGARMMVLVTYRDVELRREHPLADALGELAREGLSQRILLRGLTERDVSRFIEITAGLSPPEALVEAVFRETEGNPFFFNEVVRLLVADGRLERPEEVKSWSVTIPQGVREVVGRRLNHLSKECNGVLIIASVIGREFGLDALERVTNVTGDRLLAVLEEAVAARVAAEVPGAVDRYSFTHALIRETLYEELGTSRRVRLHRQIGEVLEGLYGANPEPYLAELAYHFSEGAQGGDVDKAIDYATQAAERATSLTAYEDAAGHYQTALQTLDVKDKPDEAQRCGILLALGDSLWNAGDPDRAGEVFLQAADIARRLAGGEHLARAALGLGGPTVSEFGIADERLVTLLKEALSALGEEDGDLRVRVLSRLAQELSLTSPDAAQSLSRQAVEVARRLAAPETLAWALFARHWTLWGRPDDVEDRLAIATEIVRLGEGSGNRAMEGAGHDRRLADLLMLGDMPGVDGEIEALARVAEELRLPGFLWSMAVYRAMRALLDGRFEEGERLAQEALVMGQRAQSQFAAQVFVGQMFAVRLGLGPGDADILNIKRLAEQYPTLPILRCLLALLYSELGSESEARAEFDHLAANDFADLPQDVFWLSAVAAISQVCVFLGDARRAAMLYELLLPYSGLNVNSGAATCNGSASRYLGLLAATMGRWEEAADHFEDALQMNARMGARPYVARTQHDYAGMLLARDEPGDREKALVLLGQALDTAQELGMKPLVEKALALKLRAQGIDTTSPQTSIDAVASAVYVDKPDLRQHAAPDGTVTILFSDIEGSTAITERLGDQRWLELLRAHNAIVRTRVAAHDGFEVKSEGDGFMLAFQSARKALECAVDIQRAFAERNESAEEPIRVRIGLHTGEAIKEADDFFGKNVILAARIAGQAQGGEI
ncbi:MAG: AAA family ATPase, partial [Dehalococcoidia bacterium]